MSSSEVIQLIRRTREHSEGRGIPKLLFRAIPLLYCVILLPLYAISIAEIVIGALYLDDCPLQPNIPIYLIVCGASAFTPTWISCLPCAKKPEDGSTNPLYSVCLMWNSLVSLFGFCWLIAGSVWIYSIYPPNYNKNSTNVDPYCDKTVYLFAFWITTACYISLGSCLFLCCCCALCYCCCKACIPTEDV